MGARPIHLLFGVILSSLPATLRAQTSESQFWSDLTAGYNFGAIYLAEMEVGYQGLLEGSPDWKSYSITPTLEASFTPHLDVISGFPFSLTQQDDDVRTQESRVQLGLRYHVLPFKKVQPRITFRGEQRFFNTLEPEPMKSQSGRIRLNGAIWFAIDKPLMSYDTLWYVWMDYEVFTVLDEQVQERYANRSIGRLGVGRKFSYNWRLEFVYSLMRARDEIDELRNDQDLDNIYRVSLKYYMNSAGRRLPRRSADP